MDSSGMLLDGTQAQVPARIDAIATQREDWLEMP